MGIGGDGLYLPQGFFVFFFFVISDWRPALNLAALDCAEETNSAVCRDFNIPGFPTVRVCDRERAVRAWGASVVGALCWLPRASLASARLSSVGVLPGFWA